MDGINTYRINDHRDQLNHIEVGIHTGEDVFFAQDQAATLKSKIDRELELHCEAISVLLGLNIPEKIDFDTSVSLYNELADEFGPQLKDILNDAMIGLKGTSYTVNNIMKPEDLNAMNIAYQTTNELIS